MSNDPYAAAADFNDYNEDGPPRKSALAVWSLVCSLICCIPGLSSLGALFGIFALIKISGSNGRLAGQGLAIAGIVIGVIVSIIHVFLAVGYQAASTQYLSFGQALTHLDNNEFDAARGMLTQNTKQFATDEQLTAFRDTYKAESGAHQSWPTGFANGMMKVFPLMFAQGENQPNIPYSGAMPVPGTFENGDRIVWFALSQVEDDDSGARSAIINIGVMADDGSLTWLVEPSVLTGPLPTETNASDSSETDDTTPEPADPTPEDDAASEGEG